MSGQRQRFQPPEPKYGGNRDAPEPPAAVRRGSWTPLTISLSVLSALVVAGLVVALTLLWGKPTQPSQGVAAPPYTAPGEAEPGQTAEPTPTPYVVQPGETVPIEKDAVFEQGFTLVYPEVGDWNEQEIVNRPNQLTIFSPDYSAQLQVWQTSVFDSNQTDLQLTNAQLNHVGDECADGVTNVSAPEPYLLEGKDGTRLELLLVRATGCEGGEVWLIERVMPLSGTRVHIVVWSADSIAHDPALLEKLAEVTFTSP